MHNPIQYLFRKKSDRRAGRKSNLPLVLLVLLLVLIQWTCEVVPLDNIPATNTPATDNTPATNDTPATDEPEDTGKALSTIRDITSRKWWGVTTIPDWDFMFIDAGEKKTNCFSFTDVVGKNVTTHDWKSDIYIKNAAPQEVWFYSGNKKDLDSVSISPAGNKTAFYFIMRYNVPDTHLDDYVNRKLPGNPGWYAVYYVLEPLIKKAGTRKDWYGSTVGTFKGYSLFMPVFVRNFKKDGDKVSMELNFGPTFDVKKSTTQNLTETEWSNIFATLKQTILSDMNLVRNAWTTYTAVDNVENGARGCPDNPRK